MNILRIGDPHIRPNNIEEANKLMEFIKQTVIAAKVDRLEILGDLLHTHAVIRLEVQLFWNKWIPIFRDLVETVIIVGNHDMAGDHNLEGNALTVFKILEDGRLKIVDVPTKHGVYAYMPYMHSSNDFVTAAKGLASTQSKVLVCHATFSGSQYDNGFYAPDGINPDDIPFDTIISGHIHKEQIIANGKVDYPGTAKWDTSSDANENKGIWLYEHDDITGKVLSRDLISTKHVCTPIVSVTWKEGENRPKTEESSRTTVELIGSSDWISKQKTVLKGKFSVRSKCTDQRKTATRKAGKSLENFLINIYCGLCNDNSDKEELISYAKELGIV